jgi:hypothetical protein
VVGLWDRSQIPKIPELSLTICRRSAIPTDTPVHCGALRSTVSPGGLPASDTALVAAVNLANLLPAWKTDVRAFELCLLQFKQFKAAVTAFGARDAFPGWYGFQGPGHWAMYPRLVSQSALSKAADALSAFN